MADPTPAFGGTITRLTPIFSATLATCSGAAPPNAIIVCWLADTPRSTVCARAALAMFSQTIS